mmetsp:Transcript_4301/g.13160  ORF Transcript_4301/g.13160 Transcript_4301/m.13160 type:complete len:309 (-) Transcript_4301:105-1031(-)
MMRLVRRKCGAAALGAWRSRRGLSLSLVCTLVRGSEGLVASSRSFAAGSRGEAWLSEEQEEVTRARVELILERAGVTKATVHSPRPYLVAFAHPSTNSALAGENQRLEFLGDAVLGSVIASLAFEHLRNGTEGDLTLTRSNVVKRTSLASFAQALGLGQFVKADLSERILADTFESFLAARYLDVLDATSDVGTAYAAAHSLVAAVVRRHGADLFARSRREIRQSPKGQLNELCQRYFNATAVYRCVETRGSKHEPIFTMRVVTPLAAAQATASTKSEASQLAAALAIKDFHAKIRARRRPPAHSDPR